MDARQQQILLERRVADGDAHRMGLLIAGPDARRCYANLSPDEWVMLGWVQGEHSDYGLGPERNTNAH